MQTHVRRSISRTISLVRRVSQDRCHCEGIAPQFFVELPGSEDPGSVQTEHVLDRLDAGVRADRREPQRRAANLRPHHPQAKAAVPVGQLVGSDVADEIEVGPVRHGVARDPASVDPHHHEAVPKAFSQPAQASQAGLVGEYHQRNAIFRQWVRFAAKERRPIRAF